MYAFMASGEVGRGKRKELSEELEIMAVQYHMTITQLHVHVLTRNMINFWT